MIQTITLHFYQMLVENNSKSENIRSEMFWILENFEKRIERAARLLYTLEYFIPLAGQECMFSTLNLYQATLFVTFCDKMAGMWA